MVKTILSFLLAISLAATTLAQQGDPLSTALNAVVGVTAEIPETARTAAFLGRHREGSGVVIDDSGLIVTIGYLILEANKIEVTDRKGRTSEATFVGYDPNSGVGMIRANHPLDAGPIAFGASSRMKRRDPVMIVQFSAENPAVSGVVVSRRNFAGYWEYLLEDAIFAFPPIRNFAGAALLNRDFELVGIGHLFVGDAAGEDTNMAGNMYVPADRVLAVMADLIAVGRPSGPAKPWLGVNLREALGRVVINRVSRGGPAEKSGLLPGDFILRVGGEKFGGLEEFYRKLWRLGSAGVEVPLQVLQGSDVRLVKVITRERFSRTRAVVPGK